MCRIGKSFAAFLWISCLISTSLVTLTRASGNTETIGFNDVIVFLTDGVDLASGKCRQSVDAAGRNEESRSGLAVLMDVVGEAFKTIGNQSIDVFTLQSHPCDDSVAATRLLLDVVTTRSVIGVITALAKASSKDVAHVTGSLRVPMLQMVSGGDPMTSSIYAQHYIVPHTSFTQIQIFLDLAKHFNWTSVSTTTTDSNEDKTDNKVQSFHQLVSNHGLCPLSISIPAHVPTLVFEGSSQNKNVNIDQNRRPLVLFDAEDDNEYMEMYEEVLRVTLEYTPWNQVFKNLIWICPFNSSRQERYTKQFADKIESLCMHIMHSLKTQKNLELFRSGGNLLTAFGFLMHRVQRSSNVTCNTSVVDDINLCSLVNQTFKVDETSNTITSELIEYTVRHEKLYQFGNKTIFPTLENINDPALYNISCGEFCHLCLTCFPKSTSPTPKAMVSRSFDPFYLVGFFPIHTKNCKSLNMEGVVQAVTFLSTIDMLNDKGVMSSTMAGIQGVVLDSCESYSKIETLKQDIETCGYSFPLMTRQNNTITKGSNSITLQPNLILAYVVPQLDYLPSKKDSENAGTTAINVASVGYSSHQNIYKRFIDSLVDVLIHVKWTFVNLIVSKDDLFSPMSFAMSKMNKLGQFCIVNIIYINRVTTDSDFLKLVSKYSEQTSVFVLLTTKEDTVWLVSNLAIHGQLNTSLQFVFTPWNTVVMDEHQTSVIALTDVNIILEPNITDTSVTLDISTLYRYMSMYTDIDTGLNHFNETIKEEFMQDFSFLRVLQSTIVDVMSDSYDLWERYSKEKFQASALSIYVKYSKIAEKQCIGNIDTTISMEPNITIEPHNDCQTWCPSCYACAGKTPEMPYFYLPGDLIITGQFSFHQKGEKAFQCGEIKEDKSVDLSLGLAFIHAIDTVKSRYPDIMANISLGGLIFDSCSDPWIGSRTIADFESCKIKLETNHDSADSIGLNGVDEYSPSPVQNVAYFIGDQSLDSNVMKDVLHETENEYYDLTKMRANDAYSLSVAVIKMLKSVGWSHAVLIIEDSPYYKHLAQQMLTTSKYFQLCFILQKSVEPGNVKSVEEILGPTNHYPIVILMQKKFTLHLFRLLGNRASDYFWILPITTDNLSHIDDLMSSAPVGTFCVSVSTVFTLNKTLNSVESSVIESYSKWMKDFWSFRYSCDFSSSHANSGRFCPNISYDLESMTTSHMASLVVAMVDAVAHKVNESHSRLCSHQSGVCKDLVPMVLDKSLGPRNVSFPYEGEMVWYDENGRLHQTLDVMVQGSSGFRKVGTYYMQDLRLDIESLKGIFQDINLSLPNTSNFRVKCTKCPCIYDINTTKSTWDLHALARHQYHSYRGEFIEKIWTIVIFSVSCSGAFLSLCLACYVLNKVCKRKIGRRYVGLGLFILTSLIVLYLSVIPYILTPTETICGLRYILPAISFSLCFAGILVKIMSLQNYKLLGLGGEISALNQFLTVFFMAGVQIAISTQWWYYTSPTMHSKFDVHYGMKVKYACNFEKLDFCLHHIYNFLVLLIASFYAIAVRNEKKNLGEAKLLLISCWLCVIFWTGWLVCIIVLDDFYRDKVVCIAVLACASAINFVVFLPKIRMVAELKYSVSQRSDLQTHNGGYNLDNDFLYERPSSLSLPGTLSPHFPSMMNNNFPKTISTLDLDINY